MKRAVLGAALIGVSVSASLAGETLLVVADEWPPFSGDDLPGKGLSVDVTRAVLTRAGYDVETAILPWARVVKGAESGAYDVVTSLFEDPDMQKLMTYSEPFFETSVHFVQKSGNDIVFDGLESLRPYRIAVGTGFLYERNFDTADFLKKVEVTTTLQGVKMVAAERVDLTLDSAHVVRHSILMDDPDLLGQIELLDPALTTQRIHMAVSRSREDHARIAADFNAALEDMRADGSLAQLLEKHKVD
ncbi:transporter substrate-binding domain-containing protein [Roseobacter sp. YSTF-M11]|uniref:Transporter substrate-binding domain-containing protein n=1 Tax=Roseobacter insulae TaxID=2859783 RepID=A0A9X1FYD6_9RHOB|nr:transporter substrate-binding domain-containing protein [Roseobacter insulae]MBW4710420.1 transporter substrate-binding domain-containing protein [Roseobacter insulae]